MNIVDEKRNSGLDILRCIAIILVFLSHYNLLTHQKLFGPLGQVGGIGVDLFFALSGYLIGHQIFYAQKNGIFSIKIFYIRRFLRILPNYFIVLGLYFFVPFFREKPLIIPLWKFITFTQNFYLIPGAFSHAWSLCIEEHFYLILPMMALFFVRKNSFRTVSLMISSLLIAEILIRGLCWQIWLRHAHENIGLISMKMIYAATYTRLDSLTLGVSLALITIYRSEIWEKIMKKGNYFLLFGILIYCLVMYMYQKMSPNEFLSAVFSYSLLALGSVALTLSALSKNSILYKVRIPGAMQLATLSYAIYLTHKSFIHITQTVLLQGNFHSSNAILLPVSILTSILGGWLLYSCVERPFLKLRDRWKNKENATDFVQSVERSTAS